MMNPSYIAPAIIIPLIGWRIYARMRRNVGRQSLNPKRMVARIVALGALSLFLGVATFAHPSSLAALGGGLLLGVPLALLGLHLTKFETTPEGNFYTPNTAIGVVITLLFVGRLAYRLTVLFADTPGVDPLRQPQLFQSPLTMVIFGIIAGYYIAYYAGVLRKGGSKKSEG
jgi:hypothetical protein